MARRSHYDYDEFDGPSQAEIDESSISRKRYLRDLHNYPDCRDPSHPGCPICNGSDECDDPVEEWDDEGDELYCISEEDLPTDDEEE